MCKYDYSALLAPSLLQQQQQRDERWVNRTPRRFPRENLCLSALTSLRGGRRLFCAHTRLTTLSTNRLIGRPYSWPVCPCARAPPPPPPLPVRTSALQMIQAYFQVIWSQNVVVRTTVVVGYVNAVKTIQVLFQVYNLSPRRGWSSQLTTKHTFKNACSQACPHSSSSSSSCSLPFGTDSTRVNSLGIDINLLIVSLCPEI